MPLQMNEETMSKISLIVYQMEEGESRTPHLQGYVEVGTPTRLAGMKKLIPAAHFERRQGTKKQAIDYCLKEDTRHPDFRPVALKDGIPIELDVLCASLSGKKTSTSDKLEEIRIKLCEGSTSIEQVADNDFDLWVRHYRAFEKYVCMKTRPRNHEVEVHVVQGPTGTGKSKWAMETYPNAYWKQRSTWWDGYANHDTVIIDEFYGWLPFDLILRICDRYPMLVETKGGQCQFVAKTIVFTSNSLPSSWYNNCYFPSFVRRVTSWHVMKILGDHDIYHDYAEAARVMSDNVFSP